MTPDPTEMILKNILGEVKQLRSDMREDRQVVFNAIETQREHFNAQLSILNGRQRKLIAWKNVTLGMVVGVPPALRWVFGRVADFF